MSKREYSNAIALVQEADAIISRLQQIDPDNSCLLWQSCHAMAKVKDRMTRAQKAYVAKGIKKPMLMGLLDFAIEPPEPFRIDRAHDAVEALALYDEPDQF